MSGARTIPAANSTDVVSFTIKTGGSKLPRSINVLSATVTRMVNKIPSCTLTIIDGEASKSKFTVSNEAYFLPGTEVEILAGYRMKEEKIFKGIVVRQSLKIREGSNLLIVEVKDKAVKLAQEKHSRYFENKKDSAIIEELVGAYGLSKDIADTGAEKKEMVQYYCTDWDFIVTRAEASNMICMVEDGKVIVKKPAGSSAALEVLYGATILEFDAEMDARSQLKGVKSVAWSHTDQKLTEVTAAEPSLPKAGNVSNTDLADVVNKDNFLLPHGGMIDENGLQKWADACLMKSRLAKIQGRVKFRGYGAVMPGNVIKLAGVGDRFNGEVFVSGVRHELYNGGWQTDVQFGLSAKWFAEENDVTHLPAGGMLPGVKGLQIGVVTGLKDEAGEFRVKVKIPAISTQEEGIWARMVMPDAGKERGFFFRPELNDEVIVGFLYEDPNCPVILGGVHSSSLPSPLEQTEDNHEKGLFTRSKMKWVWNDEKKSLTIETPAGKKLVMDEDKGVIQMEDENGNKFIMNSDGITIESAKEIKIKAGADLKMEGVNFELSASASGKVKGSAGLEASAGGNTVIKGAMVQIN